MACHPSNPHHRWLLPLCALVLLTACRRDAAELPGASTEPATAVRQLAQYLHDNDLVAYARASVPPAEYAKLEIAWAQGHSRWPLTELPLDDKLPGVLASLSAADAEQRLQGAFKAQIAGQATGVRQAAHSLGLFGVQYLSNQGDYSDEERAHYVQVVGALSDWAVGAPLSDSKLAESTISTLTSAARNTNLTSDEAFQQAGMSASLQQLGPLLHAVKQVLASYGLALDESLSQLRVGLLSERGDEATVRVQYPLAAEQLDIQVALLRRDGHWYLKQTLVEVEAMLQQAVDAEATRLAAETAAEEADEVKEPAVSPAKP